MASFHTGEKLRDQDHFSEKIISIDRVSRVMAGGRRMRVRAVVLVGDGQGTIGLGIGKSAEYQDAVRKAAASARRHTVVVPFGSTIPRRATAKYGSSVLLLKPAQPGTSIMASSVVRAVCELAGIENIVAKQLGSENKLNVVGATFAALTGMKSRAVEAIVKE